LKIGDLLEKTQLPAEDRKKICRCLEQSVAPTDAVNQLM